MHKHTTLRRPQLLVIVGPTGSGKTAAGIAAAQQIGNAAVVSADSRQVYAGMNIGTAKPIFNFQSSISKEIPNPQISDTTSFFAHNILMPDVVEGVPHYLLNIRRPDEPLALAQWQQAAFVVIDQLIKAGTTPILVGGTMLYVDSIVFNYDIPEVAPDAALRADLEQRPAAELYAELLTKDPAAKAFIEPGNTRRIIRALEVIAKTGRPFSQSRKKRVPKYDVQMVGLFPRLRQGFGAQAGWDELEKRLRARAEAMLEEGLLKETQQLIDLYGRDLPLLQTINYKQSLAMLAGEMNEQEAVAAMTRANVRYARRQMSWWSRKVPPKAGPRDRRGWEEINWFTDAEEAVKSLHANI